LPLFTPINQNANFFSPRSLDRQRLPLYFTNRLINLLVKYIMLTDQLSSTFAALADPTRRAILTKLSKGERSVSDLAEPFEMTLPAISKHLKVLEKAGLIQRSRDAQYRPCKLNAKPLREAAKWVEQYRQFWEERFDRLDDYLAQLQGKQPQGKEKKRGRKQK
jgi:DNA-binding transcriptional ArsR family regulator